jgi:hypothetical protein
MSSAPTVSENRVEIDAGDNSAPVITEKKFADQIRDMVTIVDKMKTSTISAAIRAKNEQFCQLADQFMAEMRKKIEDAKRRLRHKNNRSLSAVIYPPKMVGNIPSHVFIYGGTYNKKNADGKKDYQNRDKNFFRKRGYKISLIEELQLETFDRDGLFLLNVSDPSKGFFTRFIVSADTNPEEMKETLWHNQNKIPDLKKLRFVAINRPRFTAPASCTCTFGEADEAAPAVAEAAAAVPPTEEEGDGQEEAEADAEEESEN